MRLGVTLNCGNYESFRIDTSEHKYAVDCYTEMLHLLRLFHDATEHRKSNTKYWISVFETMKHQLEQELKKAEAKKK